MAAKRSPKPLDPIKHSQISSHPLPSHCQSRWQMLPLHGEFEGPTTDFGARSDTTHRLHNLSGICLSLTYGLFSGNLKCVEELMKIRSLTTETRSTTKFNDCNPELNGRYFKNCDIGPLSILTILRSAQNATPKAKRQRS